MIKQPKDFVDYRAYKSLNIGQLLVVAVCCAIAIGWAGCALLEGILETARKLP